MSSLISIIIVLLVAGLVLYLIDKYLPIDPLIKRILYIVIIIAIIVWLLRVAGLWGGVVHV